MEKLISGPLAQALERGRSRYNSRFAYVSATGRRLDPDDFGNLLGTVVGPIIDSVALYDPAAVDPVTETLFDLALELMGRDCLGPTPRHALVQDVWRRLLPEAAHLLAAQPRRLTASMSNAAFNLSRQPGARGRVWLELMKTLAGKCRQVDEFLAAGQVAAWRSGLSQYRDGALEILASLPDVLAFAALGLSGTTPPNRTDLLEILTDRWRHPDGLANPGPRKLMVVARVGGFRGFGGAFVSPPEVARAGETIMAFDREFCYSVHADCFGATLARFGRDLPGGLSSEPGALIIEATGRVSDGARAALFSGLANPSSSISTAQTLAVTLARSHYVFLVAWAERAAELEPTRP